MDSAFKQATISGNRLEVWKIGSLVLTVLKRTEEKITTLLDGRISTHIPPISSLRDDYTNQSPGYSFLLEDNTTLQEARHRLLWVLTEDQSWKRPNGQWNDGLTRAFLKTAEEINLNLLLLTHMACGQPARGTEMAKIQLRNAPNISRGVYIHGEDLMFVTRYNKVCYVLKSKSSKSSYVFLQTTSTTKQWKTICRFTFPALTTAWLKYLILLLKPIETFTQSLGGSTDVKNYVFWRGCGSCHNDLEAIREPLQKLTAKEWGFPCSIRMWHHLATGLSRKKRIHVDEGPDNSEDTPEDLQAGRSTEVSVCRYAVTEFQRAVAQEGRIDLFKETSKRFQKEVLLLDFD